MALECTLCLHREARQGLDTVSGDITNCTRLSALQFKEVAAVDCVQRAHTSCVSKLILLPFYPVLQSLSIAPCDLNFLLDRILVHVGHATL